MKLALTAAAALTASATALATPSSTDSIRDVPPREPMFTLNLRGTEVLPPQPNEGTLKFDLRLRDDRGQVRPDLWGTAPKKPTPLTFESPHLREFDPKPITPQGDGEFPAMHIARRRDQRFIVPMPTTKGNFVDPKMPMVMPDPAVDYKLHVREMIPSVPEDSKK